MNPVLEAVGAVSLVVGAILTLISAIGLVRFPTTLSRAHALGLGSTAGVLFVMFGVVCALSDLGAAAKAILTVIFLFLTSPVGSHMLGRVAHQVFPESDRLTVDELGPRKTPD